MQAILMEKLHGYIKENNPDLLLQLEEENKVTAYLSDKIKSLNELLHQQDGVPLYIMEEVCLDALTRDLRPSKFNYIRNLLQEEFGDIYYLLEQTGTVQFECINLVKHCTPVFDEAGFAEENEAGSNIRHTIVGTISEYFEALENVSHELQQPAKITG